MAHHKPNRKRPTKHPRFWSLTYSMHKHFGNKRDHGGDGRFGASTERRIHAAEATRAVP